jgi:hypothetical protein
MHTEISPATTVSRTLLSQQIFWDAGTAKEFRTVSGKERWLRLECGKKVSHPEERN